MISVSGSAAAPEVLLLVDVVVVIVVVVLRLVLLQDLLLGLLFLVAEVRAEDLHRLEAVDLEPVGADQVLLVEDGVVGAQEPEVLELKK